MRHHFLAAGLTAPIPIRNDALADIGAAPVFLRRTPALESELCRKLQLSSVEHGPRQAEIGIRLEWNKQNPSRTGGRKIARRQATCYGRKRKGSGLRHTWNSLYRADRASRGCRALLDGNRCCVLVVAGDSGRCPAENRRTIHGGHLIDVRTIEEIECVHAQFDLSILG